MSDFILFGEKKIRRILYEGEWFFPVVDVVGVLTESSNSRDYWYRLKVREKESSNVELSTKCRQLKLKSSDGKEYLTDCANIDSNLNFVRGLKKR